MVAWNIFLQQQRITDAVDVISVVANCEFCLSMSKIQMFNPLWFNAAIQPGAPFDTEIVYYCLESAECLVRKHETDAGSGKIGVLGSTLNSFR
jgi:hypothetical protein